MSVQMPLDSGQNISSSAIDQPSGIPMISDGSQDNAPISASIGAGNNYQANILSGTDKNTPKSLEVWQWDKYSFLYNAYYELGGFYNGTALRKAQSEKDDEYIERRGTSYYRNFFRPIIDATYLPVFSSGATRRTTVKDTLDEDGTLCPLWNKFQDNVDNRHCQIQKFMKKVIKYSNMLGVSFIVVDNFPQVPQNTQDALDNRLFPYVYIRYPQQVEGCLTQLDEFGKLNAIAFREAPENIEDPVTKQKKLEPRWKLWTKDYSVMLKQEKKYQQGGRKVEWIEIPGTKKEYLFNEVPVIPVMSGDVEEDTVLPHPRFYSIARCNLALYNLDSSQMRLVRAQMFAMLILPQTSDNEGRTTTVVGPLRNIFMPPDRDGVTHAKPFYLSPDTGPYSQVATTSHDLIQDLFRLAGQIGITGVQKAASGVSKAFDFQAQMYVLQETAKTSKIAEERIAHFFKKYVISEQFDYDVVYEDNYSPLDIDQDVKMYGDYISLDPGPKGRALALEQCTRAVFNDMDDEDVQPTIEEIRQNAENDSKIGPQIDETIPLTPEEQLAKEQQDLLNQTKPNLDISKKPVNKFKTKPKFTVRTAA